jgi:hypothetical protein
VDLPNPKKHSAPTIHPPSTTRTEELFNHLPTLLPLTAPQENINHQFEFVELDKKSFSTPGPNNIPLIVRNIRSTLSPTSVSTSPTTTTTSLPSDTTNRTITTITTSTTQTTSYATIPINTTPRPHTTTTYSANTTTPPYAPANADTNITVTLTRKTTTTFTTPTTTSDTPIHDLVSEYQNLMDQLADTISSMCKISFGTSLCEDRKY